MILDWKQYWKTAHEGIKKHNDKHTTMSTFKTMKFQVESPEHSKQIQECLFELGYDWLVGKSKHTINTEKPFLHTEEDGDIMFCNFDLDHTKEYKETTLVELQEMVALKISAERKKEIEHAGKAIFEQINTLTRSAKRSAEFVDRVAKVMTEPKPPFEKGHDDSTNVTKPNNIDLIKRIETLEKQMSMIHAYNTPLNAHPFRPEPKFATGRLVEGLEKPIQHEKHVEFTSYISFTEGRKVGRVMPSYWHKIRVIGKTNSGEDVFAALNNNSPVYIYIGHLNSGTY